MLITIVLQYALKKIINNFGYFPNISLVYIIFKPFLYFSSFGPEAKCLGA